MRDDEPIRRFSRKPNPYLIPVIAIGVIAALITAGCVIALGVALSNRGNVSGGQGVGIPGLTPTADNEGLNWTTKELAEYLHSRNAIGEYEVHDERKAGFIQIMPMALARTPNGGEVSLIKHGGSLSAEQYAKRHRSGSDGKHYADDPAYQWGAFTIVSGESDKDHAAPLAAKLRGVKKFVRGELVK